MTDKNRADQAKDLAKKGLSFAQTEGAKALEQAKEKAKEVAEAQAQKKESSSLDGTPMRPRTHPKHTIIQSENEEIAEFTVPAMRTGWWWKILLFIVIGIPVLGALSTGLGFYQEEERVFRNTTMVWKFSIGRAIFWGIVLFGGTIFALWKSIYKKLKISVTPTRLKVNEFLFDRQHNPRFGIGFTEKGGNAFNPAMAFTGLQTVRVQYGQWGENLPYLIPELWAVEYLTWANTFLDKVQVPKQATIKDGHRKQAF